MGSKRFFDRVTLMSLAACLLNLVFASTAIGDLTLTEKGQSKYHIVLATNAIPSERYAAEELQRYLEKISAAKLEIISDAEAPVSREIVLGDNPRSAKLKIDFAQLGPDGFVMRTEGNRLFIAGGKPRGTLNGIHTFLEEKLGVRWFTPELEKVPKLDRVRLPKLNETRVPALQNRDVFWSEMMHNPDFAARHRLNGQHYGLTEKHGGPYTVYFPFVHSLDALLPRELFKDHPEYFPLINGKRKDGYVQRCLSNPDVLKISIERVRQWLKEHPESTIISVSQNDTINNCQCEQCKTLDDAEGSPAGSLLKFVNAIAEAIEPEHPNVRIDTLAYQYTRKPPKTIRPRRNVIIRLCSIECCFSHPLETCPAKENTRFRDDIVAWGPVAPLLYVWDYTTDFGHYQQPFPNFDSLQSNVRFFVKHGVKSLFEQGNYSGGGGGEMEPLRAYLLAKLLWNPDTDVKKHTDEFVNAYYGKAAPKILAYLEASHRPVREKGLHAHIFDKPRSAYLSEDVMNECEKMLDEAEQLAENDEVRFRVQVARLPVWYVKLATHRSETDNERTQLIKRFFVIARKAGISNISESTSLDDWAKKQAAPEGAAKNSEKISHAFLATGAETYIVGADGKTEWTYPLSTRDGWVLPDGHLLLTLSKCDVFPGGAVREVTREGKVLFEYKGTQSEVNTAEKLGNGNVLVSEAGAKPRLLEIDPHGEIVVEVPLSCQTTNHHMESRMARKLPNGNYLVPQLLDKVVREYTPKGEIVWEVKTPHWPFTAIRLPGGNTLINCTYGNLSIEVDGAGKIVWQLSNEDLPKALIKDACGAQRLANGNTVITSYGIGADQTKLIEVTPDKQVVWSYTDPREHGIHHFQILGTDGRPLDGPIMR